MSSAPAAGSTDLDRLLTAASMAGAGAGPSGRWRKKSWTRAPVHGDWDPSLRAQTRGGELDEKQAENDRLALALG